MIAADTETETPVVFFEADDMPVFGVVETYITGTSYFSVIVKDNHCAGAFHSVRVHYNDLFYSDIEMGD